MSKEYAGLDLAPTHSAVVLRSASGVARYKNFENEGKDTRALWKQVDEIVGFLLSESVSFISLEDYAFTALNTIAQTMGEQAGFFKLAAALSRITVQLVHPRRLSSFFITKTPMKLVKGNKKKVSIDAATRSGLVFTSRMREDLRGDVADAYHLAYFSFLRENPDSLSSESSAISGMFTNKETGLLHNPQYTLTPLDFKFSFQPTV